MQPNILILCIFVFRRRHNIRIMSVGKYRMLKDLRTNKFVNTKSEVTTLAKFIEWLEENRGEATDGIILVYHEVHKTIPAMLLESMRRHGLDERFAKVVKGFANSYGLSASKCANTTKTFTLRVMSKVTYCHSLQTTHVAYFFSLRCCE